VEGWIESLTPEVAPFGIRTMLVEPGFFRTELLPRCYVAVQRSQPPGPPAAARLLPVRLGRGSPQSPLPPAPSETASSTTRATSEVGTEVAVLHRGVVMASVGLSTARTAVMSSSRCGGNLTSSIPRMSRPCSRRPRLATRGSSSIWGGGRCWCVRGVRAGPRGHDPGRPPPDLTVTTTPDQAGTPGRVTPRASGRPVHAQALTQFPGAA
jgi:hypothetical protein